LFQTWHSFFLIIPEKDSLGICTWFWKNNAKNKSSLFLPQYTGQGIVVEIGKGKIQKMKEEEQINILLELRPLCHAFPPIRDGES
jgi:hypothetical protein